MRDRYYECPDGNRVAVSDLPLPVLMDLMMVEHDSHSADLTEADIRLRLEIELIRRRIDT